MLALLVACSFVNASWKTGSEAYEAKDYKAASKEFKYSAEQGDIESQAMLGLCIPAVKVFLKIISKQ